MIADHPSAYMDLALSREVNRQGKRNLTILDFTLIYLFRTCNNIKDNLVDGVGPPYFEYLNWTASSEFGTYRLCEQRRFRRACACTQSRQNLRCSLIQAVSQKEPSDRKPDPWPLWMAGHAQLKFVMTECSKTQMRLTGLSFQRPP